MLYRALSKFGDQFVYPVLPAFAKSIWDHPAEPKTVFFWAPLMKWGLNIALFITGGIWTRYSFVIIPVGYSLATVYFLVMCSVFSQLFRIAITGLFKLIISKSEKRTLPLKS
uniref:Mitochondrial pyruvate carrier n=1 Tax=Angiostrongylus cantonensis TaxID=6313 RepID=A0A0K0D9X3_ANGCA